MKKPIITFEQFSFQYDSQSEPSLKNVQVTIYEGEKVLIVGPSGSGKSTFGKCINGLIPYAHNGEVTGQLLIGDQSSTASSIFSRSLTVGTVLQDTDGQFVGLSVGEDIAFSLENEEVDQKEMKKTVLNWAEKVDVDSLLKHRPQLLSGGQKQRVAMAGVMVDPVPILLFDEPLASLDPQAGEEAIQLIKEIQKQTKKLC